MLIPQSQPSINRVRLADALSKHILEGGHIGEGKKTQELEQKLAEFVGSKYCFMTTSGTMSLILALLALEITIGDEVLIPDFTMIAIVDALHLIGAVPVPVDVDAKTLCLDPAEILKKTSKKTRALVYVTSNGRGNYHEVEALCKSLDISYISDDAQSLGSKFNETEFIGSRGDLSCMSFAASKIITTGQGGCIFTNSSRLSKRITRVKNFGRLSSSSDDYSVFGINSKFPDLLSVVGLEQFKELPARITRKKAIYKKYRDLLRVEMPETNLSVTTPWFVDIYVDDRELLIERLRGYDIEARPVFPPIHEILGLDKKSFPISEQYSRRGVFLPSSVDLTDVEIEYICSKIRNEFYE